MVMNTFLWRIPYGLNPLEENNLNLTPLEDFKRGGILLNGNVHFPVENSLSTKTSRGDCSNLHLTPVEGRC